MGKTKNVNSEVKNSDGLYNTPIYLGSGSKTLYVNQPGNIVWLIKIIKERKGKQDIIKYVKVTGSTGSVKNNWERTKAKALNSARFLFGKKYGSPTSTSFIDYRIRYAKIEGERPPKRERWGKKGYITVVRDDKGRIITWNKYTNKKLGFESDLDIEVKNQGKIQ